MIGALLNVMGWFVALIVALYVVGKLFGKATSQPPPVVPKLLVTRTGRLSCREPNLAGVPQEKPTTWRDLDYSVAEEAIRREMKAKAGLRAVLKANGATDYEIDEVIGRVDSDKVDQNLPRGF